MGIAQVAVKFEDLRQLLGIPSDVEITHISSTPGRNLMVHLKSDKISKDNPSGWGSMIIPLDEVRKM
jgi:hypothetical protein